jgi:hypothetical protein
MSVESLFILQVTFIPNDYQDCVALSFSFYLLQTVVVGRRFTLI